MERTFPPAGAIRGTLSVPGDKSISHRALILAAMRTGASNIRGLATGADVESTRQCLSRLGFESSWTGDSSVLVEGNGWHPFPDVTLTAGNSGTTMRLLAGALAGRSGQFLIEGDESLSRRPMRRIAEPLKLMGAHIDLADGHRPPVGISGGRLKGIDYRMPVASAQVKGALLLAGLQARGTTSITEPVQSRDHTERLLQWLGASLSVEANTLHLQEDAGFFKGEGFEVDIPGDFSSAAYLLLACCLSARGEVTFNGVGLNNTRTGLLDVLGTMGAKIEVIPEASDPEPRGNIRISSSRLEYAHVSKDLIPRVIDELPLIALAATQAEGKTLIRDAAELRVKESDRIAALATGLRTLGASVEEQPDGLSIEGPTPLTGGVVESEGDHRIALTLAVAGLIAKDPVTVKGWECAAVSYPNFEDDLKQLVQ